MIMSNSEWTVKGGTLSHNNACKEFGIPKDKLFEALEAGNLQFKENYAHGNPYYRLLRSEVEAFAKELLGDKGIEEQERKHQLKTITREINSLKRKLSALEKKKIKLLESQNK